jgi:hypothetical protein
MERSVRFGPCSFEIMAVISLKLSRRGGINFGEARRKLLPRDKGRPPSNERTTCTRPVERDFPRTGRFPPLKGSTQWVLIEMHSNTPRTSRFNAARLFMMLHICIARRSVQPNVFTIAKTSSFRSQLETQRDALPATYSTDYSRARASIVFSTSIVCLRTCGS